MGRFSSLFYFTSDFARSNQIIFQGQESGTWNLGDSTWGIFSAQFYYNAESARLSPNFKSGRRGRARPIRAAFQAERVLSTYLGGGRARCRRINLRVWAMCSFILFVVVYLGYVLVALGMA